MECRGSGAAPSPVTRTDVWGGEGRGGNRGAEKVRDTTSSDEKGG